MKVNEPISDDVKAATLTLTKFFKNCGDNCNECAFVSPGICLPKLAWVNVRRVFEWGHTPIHEPDVGD